jgi:hypothetical protein
MRLGADEVSWRWIDTLGNERSGVKWDLVALLSNGSLPPKTLVWKTGWSEWFAASRIAELADALPESSVEARLSPPSSRSVVKPPPAPVSDPRASLVDSEWGSVPPGPSAPQKSALLPEPPSEASRAAVEQAAAVSTPPRPKLAPPKLVLPSERKSEPHHAKPTPFEQESPPSSFGLLGLHGPKEKPRPKVVVTTQSNSFATSERSTESYAGHRPPMPTLSDEAAPATATLRPPAAVPPPPRSALGGPVLDPRVLSRLGREKSAVDTPLPIPPDSEALTTVPNRSATVGEITVDDQAVTERREALAPVQARRAPLSREGSGLVHTPPVHVLGEPRAPIPTIPEAPIGTLGDARSLQPTIPESAPSFSRPPSELTPAIIHAGPVVELGRSPVPPPPIRRATPNPLPPPSPPPASARPVVKPLPPPSLESTLSSETSPEPAPPPRTGARSALSSTGSPAAMEVDTSAKSAPHDAHAAPPARRSKSAFLAFGGVAAACAVVSGFLLFSRRGATNEIADPAAQSASAPPPVAQLACRIQAHPARLGAAIDRSVTPLLAPLPSGRAALGFAESPKKATGLVISPDTLDAEPSFEKAFDQALRSVVPLVAAGKPSFFARADSATLTNPRAVDGPKPFVIGAGERAILRAASGAQPEPVWEIPPKSAVTELRVASYPAGHLVTFRVGGLEGKEMVGFLNVDGTKQSELSALDAPKLLGTPFAAVSASRWVVVFAARESNQEPWHVELVTGALGSTQGSRSKFEAPPGGLGGGQIAPSIAPLSRDHWLLQWTEGKTGMYHVRTLVLDAKLLPVGEPLVVSPKGASSGQGAIFSAGERSVSLYVQTIGGHDELWATTLDCR